MEGMIVLLVLAVLAVPVLLIGGAGVDRRPQAPGRRSGGRAGERAEAGATGGHRARGTQPVAPTPAATPPVAAADAHDAGAAGDAARTVGARPHRLQRTACRCRAAACGDFAIRVASRRARIPSAARPRPDFVDLAARAVKRWFTEGNVPVKVGMLVLLAGVAALLKYASDQGWLTAADRAAPGRHCRCAALAGAGVRLAPARAQAHVRAGLQGGAIGVLLLAVFAAFKLYGLLPATRRVRAQRGAGRRRSACWRCCRTRRRWRCSASSPASWRRSGCRPAAATTSPCSPTTRCSTRRSSRSPGAKSWRVLNLLGFVFTFGIGTSGACCDYNARQVRQHRAVPAAVLRVLPAASRSCTRAGGRPAAATASTAAWCSARRWSRSRCRRRCCDGARMPLAFCALGLARAVRGAGVVVASGASATRARRRRTRCSRSASPRWRCRWRCRRARPRACSRWKARRLAWLGLRQRRRLPQLDRVRAAAGGGAGVLHRRVDMGRAMPAPVANATFMGALLIALAGFASAWAYRRDGKAQSATAVLPVGTGVVVRQRAARDRALRRRTIARADVLLAFVALTGWLAAEVHRRRPAAALASTTLGAFALAIPLAFVQTDVHAHPFAGYGLWAWLVFAALGVRSLLCLRASEDRVAAWAQFAWWLVWPTVLSLFAVVAGAALRAGARLADRAAGAAVAGARARCRSCAGSGWRRRWASVSTAIACRCRSSYARVARLRLVVALFAAGRQRAAAVAAGAQSAGTGAAGGAGAARALAVVGAGAGRVAAAAHRAAVGRGLRAGHRRSPCARCITGAAWRGMAACCRPAWRRPA